MDNAPRYEFRVFARSLDSLRDRLQQTSPVSEYRESLEIYIVSSSGAAYNAKIRNDSMDIKQLVDCSGGLEQWRPVLKQAFPLPVTVLTEHVLPVLAVPVPVPAREHYTLVQFLDEIVRPAQSLAAVSVFKQRYSFEVLDCSAEFAGLLINGAALSTVCVEAEDRERVVSAIAEWGLAGIDNVNYPTAIKRVIGMVPLPEGVYYRAF
jgi:hypothetical protein